MSRLPDKFCFVDSRNLLVVSLVLNTGFALASSRLLELDLPLDRKSQRNAYRKKLIDLMSSQRNYQQSIDDVKLQVRDAYRKLTESATRYKIQKDSLTLAEERVNSAKMLLKAGRATARDLLEAQSALLSAQNNTTSTLVDYVVSKLNFYAVRPEGFPPVRAGFQTSRNWA